MQTFKLKDFKKGGIVGNFEPTLFPCKDVEISIHYYKKGYEGVSHKHLIMTEYNLVLRGQCEVRNSGPFYQKFNKGDGWCYLPGEISDVKFMKNTQLLVIKTPSLPNDKVIIE